MTDLLEQFDIEIAVALTIVIAYALGWCVCKYDSDE